MRSHEVVLLCLRALSGFVCGNMRPPEPCLTCGAASEFVQAAACTIVVFGKLSNKLLTHETAIGFTTDYHGSTAPIWQPRYTLTPAIARGLMAIEAARAVVETTPLPPVVEAELRRRARVRSAHYSTRIEGNRLTLAQAEEVVSSSKAQVHGRERDVREVRNYWNALLRVEEWAAAKAPLTEELIRRMHALVEKGPRARPTPYRDGQNVIRDSASNAIIYLPPEAQGCARTDGGAGRLVQCRREGTASGATDRRTDALSVCDHPSLLRRERTHRPPAGDLDSQPGRIRAERVPFAGGASRPGFGGLLPFAGSPSAPQLL